MKTLLVQNLSLTAQRVLLRVDFNVPLQKNGSIIDDTRIKLALPSIEYILSQKGKLILLSHLGRPSGVIDPSLSLFPCAKRLSKLIQKPVPLAADCIGEKVRQRVEKMNPSDIMLLENLRFHKEEENPIDGVFASHLAVLGDCYVNDAFATSHRAHSSITLLPKLFPGKAAAGFLMEKEIAALSPLIKSPKRPFHIIVGGSKVGTKINVLYSLLPKIDCIYLGGAMAFTFLKAQGCDVGDSSYDEVSIPRACELLELCREKMVRIYLPEDVIGTSSMRSKVKIFPFTKIEAGWRGVDIGPETVSVWSSSLEKASTIFWNGPLGIWEKKEFSQGTGDLARRLATFSSITVAGGGDLTGALRHFQIDKKFSYVSSGGAALLEFLHRGHLPGIDVLSPV